jgi:leucyl-tRNA synthetase
MHAGVVQTYIDASVRILAPIAPHWAEHVYRNILKAEHTVLRAGWPQLEPADAGLRMAAEFIEKLIPKLRAAIDKKEAPPKKKKGGRLDTP